MLSNLQNPRHLQCMKIALIREQKSPPDVRVALTPVQCAALMNRFPQINVVAQSSPERCFSDEEYESAGITVQQDVSDCDVLLGIKEIPTEYLIPHKTYFFFSHNQKTALQPKNAAGYHPKAHPAGRL